MITIKERKLSDYESNLLSEETKKFPDIAYIAPHLWNKFPHRHILTIDNNIVGLCMVVPLNHWAKIGPLIVREKYHKKGYGKKLLMHVIDHWESSNLYIGSSHRGVWHIAESLGFQHQANFWRLSSDIQWYLASYIFQRFNLTYVADAFRKSMHKRTYRYYLRLAQQ